MKLRIFVVISILFMFSRPKHGAITYLTLNELKAVAEHWKVDIKLD